MNKNVHFAAIANVALIDEQLNDDETKVLQKFANKLDIDGEQAKAILKNADKYDVPLANTIEERLEHLYELFYMIYADHRMDEKEMKLVHKYAIGLGFTSEKAKEVIYKSIKIFSGNISLENYKYLLDIIE